MSKIAVAATLLCLTAAAQAASPYLGADAVYQRVEISGQSFNPASIRLRGGWWLWRGIAVEGSVTAGVTDDSASGLTLDVPYIASVYARFQSPDALSLRAYILLGMSAVELDGSQSNSSFPGNESFYGPSVAIGLQEQLSFLTNTSLNVEIAGHFVDDDIDMMNISVGLQYAF